MFIFDLLILFSIIIFTELEQWEDNVSSSLFEEFDDDVREDEAKEVKRFNASPNTSTEAQYSSTSSDDEEVNTRDDALVKHFSQMILHIRIKVSSYYSFFFSFSE